MQERRRTISRKTNETNIELDLFIDGEGNASINTGIAFFDHMLDLFSKHGLFDLNLSVQGDIEVDYHHSVEDVGICLGTAFREALGDFKGIKRYASVDIPMDESLCRMAIDISNRPGLHFKQAFPKTKIGTFDSELVEEFFTAFVNNARVTLHIDITVGQNLHHMIEACFKAFGRILDQASLQDPRVKGVPSTKGVL